MAEVKVSPVTLDMVKDSLIAVSNEVFYAFARTSMSPIIYETLDYASGIADVNGKLLTQGNGACGFIGLIAPMIQEIIQKPIGQTWEAWRQDPSQQTPRTHSRRD